MSQISQMESAASTSIIEKPQSYTTPSDFHENVVPFDEIDDSSEQGRIKRAKIEETYGGNPQKILADMTQCLINDLYMKRTERERRLARRNKIKNEPKRAGRRSCPPSRPDGYYFQHTSSCITSSSSSSNPFIDLTVSTPSDTPQFKF